MVNLYNSCFFFPPDSEFDCFRLYAPRVVSTKCYLCSFHFNSTLYFFLLLLYFYPLHLPHIPVTVCVVPKTQMRPQNQKEEKTTSSMYGWRDLSSVLFRLRLLWWEECHVFKISLYSRTGVSRSVLDIMPTHAGKNKLCRTPDYSHCWMTTLSKQEAQLGITKGDTASHMIHCLSTTICKENEMLS